jgi:hypothetical protein
MNLAHKRKVALAATGILAIGLSPITMRGQWAVVDAPSIAQIIAETNQIIKIYETDIAMYKQAQAMSVMITHPGRIAWQTLMQTYFNDYTRSMYGETLNWPTVMNGQVTFAQNAYSAASFPYGSNPYLALERAGQSVLLAKLATSEARDGANVRCMQMIANYNQNRQLNTAAQNRLEVDSEDDSSSTNSFGVQANIQNAVALQQMKQLQAQGDIQTCLAQQQTLESKSARDNEVENLNMWGAQQQAAQNPSNYMGPMSNSIRNFLIP